MNTYTFALVLRGPEGLTPELEDAVFEAGCDDAALSERSGIVFLEFDREARTFLDAVLSAIAQANGIEGVTVVQVEPDELVTATEIAERTGRTRESVRLLAEGERGPGGFPVPVSGASERRTRLWRWSEVADWLEQAGLGEGLGEQARTVVAINGALQLALNTDRAMRAAILEALRPL